MLTIFNDKIEVAGMMTKTLSCWVRVLLRNIISHPSCFPYRHQISIAHPVEWSMDPPQCEWTYDEGAQAIVATTTTLVRTYFYLGRMHEGVESDVPPASIDVPEALLRQPLGL